MAEVELVGGKLALVSVPLIYFISSKEYVNKLEQCSQRFFHRGKSTILTIHFLTSNINLMLIIAKG